MNDRTQIRATSVTALALLLASSSCGAVFTGWSWFPTAFLTIAVATLANLLCRWIRIPLLVHPIVVAACLLFWATVRFASDQAFAHIVPTSASWDELAQKYSYGIHALTATSAPVTSDDNTLLVLVAGIGLMALTADLLAVGAGRPSLAGLPMLTIVVVTAAMRHGGIGILPFVLATAGYLTMLSLDSQEKVIRWGRVLPPRVPLPDDRVDGSGAGRSLWRIGTASLGLAILVPIAIPGADHGHFGGAGGIGNGGSSTTTVVNPLSAIQSQLQSTETVTLLHVQTTTPTYQRLTALDNFDGNGFTLVPLSASSKDKVASGGLDQVQPPTNGTNVRETITSESRLTQAFLPIPEYPTSIQVTGDWRLAASTTTVFSSRTTTSGKTWKVTGAIPAPTVAQLQAVGIPDLARSSYPDAVRMADLAVPRNLPPIVKTTAQGWVRDANATTIYDIANAIQRNFTNGSFTYDLSVSISGGADGFREFLRDRHGYCQQYATTMAAMLRTLGIPARVAIGFTKGTLQQDGSYTITNRDAHAWPEVWFNGIGWVRFEPTPLANGTALVPQYTAAPANSPGADGTTPDETPSTAPTTGPSSSATNPDKQNQNDNGAGSVNSRTSTAGTIVWIVVSILAVMMILSVPWLTRRWRRRSRWQLATASRSDLVEKRLAEAAWANVVEDAADRGVPIPRSASPRQAGHLLRVALSEPEELPAPMVQAIDVLVGAVERARYGTATTKPDGPAATTLLQAADLICQGLVAHQHGPRRLVVTFFPPSTRRFWIAPVFDVLRAGGRAIDVGIARGDGAIRRWRSRHAPAA